MTSIAAAPNPRTRRDLLVRGGERIFATGMSGIVVGMLTYGLGLRLAMRISTLAAGPTVRGRLTENGNVIGALTVEGTGFLVLAGGAFGLVSALVYLLVGHWLPRSGWRRRLAFAGLLVALVGGLLIDPNNRDFTELGLAC